MNSKMRAVTPLPMWAKRGLSEYRGVLRKALRDFYERLQADGEAPSLDYAPVMAHAADEALTDLGLVLAGVEEHPLGEIARVLCAWIANARFGGQVQGWSHELRAAAHVLEEVQRG